MRADIAIVEVEQESEEYYLGDRVKKVLAIIELKYSSSINYISTDVEKIKEYTRMDYLDKCQFYLGFLNEETYPERQYWLDKRQTKNWAKDCVTELDACRYDDYRNCEMAFSIYSYNNYNTELNTTNIDEMNYVRLD